MSEILLKSGKDEKAKDDGEANAQQATKRTGTSSKLFWSNNRSRFFFTCSTSILDPASLRDMGTR